MSKAVVAFLADFDFVCSASGRVVNGSGCDKWRVWWQHKLSTIDLNYALQLTDIVPLDMLFLVFLRPVELLLLRNRRKFGLLNAMEIWLTLLAAVRWLAEEGTGKRCW
jgi:hypothetical protein